MPQKCCRSLLRKTFLVIFYLELLFLFFAEYFQRKSWRYSTSWKCFSSLVFPSYMFFFSRLKMSFKVGFNPPPPPPKKNGMFLGTLAPPPRTVLTKPFPIHDGFLSGLITFVVLSQLGSHCTLQMPNSWTDNFVEVYGHILRVLRTEVSAWIS